ncbi:uncharacterized protein FA14DRAFT_162165 [Meira miltonrushii]|uniref:CDP-diacylglycerol--glycerol-3-phosphate 3-phosphatidyltransferase n=1 Tax=Meira miltonrushii TaxID=1280837 RepID=A0A316V7I2_9BASI|nr:uncharacterized protein FA14DRAFT_162165 [Meira miltonrushii]PWN32978.1 hypothetical protein FA14DRAFT_162165 [Meira miltonrushii]
MSLRSASALGRHVICRSCESYSTLEKAIYPAVRRNVIRGNSGASLQKRWNSSTSPKPLGERIAEKYNLPIFRVNSDRLQLIEQPSKFYEKLLDIIRNSKKRIFLASLYIGKTEHELISALSSSLKERKELKVTILVDRLRSTREGDYRDGEKSTESCASLLAGLQSQFPNQVEIRAFRAPDLPAWLETLVGKRFVEGWGLQHMKIYGGDDSVMISGANLSNDYFTNRRDRYLFMDDKTVSDYLYELLMTASRYSYSLRATGTPSQHASYQLDWDEGARLDMKIDEQPTGPTGWKRRMGSQVERMTYEWKQRTEAARPTDSDSMDIVPLIQMGPMKVQQETTCVPEVLSYANERPNSQLYFTTGYFSINPQYAEWILKGQFQSEMITASPKANGFYGSKGVSRHLPAAYTWLTNRFWDKLVAKNRQDQVKINEWNKQGWTYHAKGIWFSPKVDSKPTLTLLGSSNFGIRSAKLDLECTFLIDAHRSSKLQTRLQEEIDELKRDAKDQVGQEMFERPERKVHWGVKVAARIIRRML